MEQVAGTGTQPPSPAFSASPGAHARRDLWAALGLPTPETSRAGQLHKRVVLLGRPQSGKRTLCRRLCAAARQQFPQEGKDGGSGAGTQTVRRPLVLPADLNDSHVCGGGTNVAPCSTLAAGDVVEGSEEEKRAAYGAAGRSSTLARGRPAADLTDGAGISYAFVGQRVPLRSTQDRGHTSISFADPSVPFPVATETQLSDTTVRCTTEFFCCDSAGALAMALPSLTSMNECVMVIVVDVSQPATVREQLDHAYAMVQAHVQDLLHTHLPSQDEVRYLQLMEVQQKSWLDEEQGLLPLRLILARGSRSGTSFAAPGVDAEAVNATVQRVPQRAGTICPLPSLLVCTKTDLLDKLSKACLTGVGTTEGGSGAEKALDTILPASLRADMRRAQLPLVTVMAQLLRHYATSHRSALVGISNRVNTAANLAAHASSESVGDHAASTNTPSVAAGSRMDTGAPLLHPFHRALWRYLHYLLHEAGCFSGSAENRHADAGQRQGGEGPHGRGGSHLPEAVVHACGAELFPCALLPRGLDAFGLLHNIVAAEGVQLPVAPTHTPEAGAPAGERNLTGGFKLHQAYVEEMKERWRATERPAASDRGQVDGADTSVAEGVRDLIWEVM